MEYYPYLLLNFASLLPSAWVQHFLATIYFSYYDDIDLD